MSMVPLRRTQQFDCSAGESIAMFSEPTLDDIDEVDNSLRAARSDLTASVTRCQQIEVAPVRLVELEAAGAIEERATAASQQGSEQLDRESAVSVHRTLVLRPSEAGEKLPQRAPPRHSSRKATLAFDFAALQASARTDARAPRTDARAPNAEARAPRTEARVPSAEARAPRAPSAASHLTIAPAPVRGGADKAHAASNAAAVSSPSFAAMKPLSGRLAAMALTATLLCTLLTTVIVLFVRGHAEQPEHPRLLHMVVPRQALTSSK
jgi:hypothetical protein